MSSQQSTLTEWVETYLANREVTASYKSDCRRFVRLFAEWNREDRLDRLTDEMIDRWAQHLRSSGMHLRMVKNHFTAVRTIWRHAAESGACETEPARRRRIPNSDVQLHDLVDRYRDWRNDRRPIGREIAKSTLRTFHHTINAFGEYLGFAPRVADLQPRPVNQWMEKMLAAGMSPRSVHSRRVSLCTIWRFAYRTKLTSVNTDEVRPIWLPALRPKGYRVEDAAALLEHAKTLQGVVIRTGIPRALYMSSLIALLWDTALRSGDATRLRVQDFEPEYGRIYVIESKTGKSGFLPLQPSTCELIAECIAVDPTRELIWPGMKPVAIAKAVRRLARDAGLEGGPKWLRRGSASEVERTNPGTGWRFLRHSRSEVFEEFYRDTGITDKNPLLPPSISDRVDPEDDDTDGNSDAA